MHPMSEVLVSRFMPRGDLHGLGGTSGNFAMQDCKFLQPGLHLQIGPMSRGCAASMRKGCSNGQGLRLPHIAGEKSMFASMETFFIVSCAAVAQHSLRSMLAVPFWRREP